MPISHQKLKKESRYSNRNRVQGFRVNELLSILHGHRCRHFHRHRHRHHRHHHRRHHHHRH